MNERLYARTPSNASPARADTPIPDSNANDELDDENDLIDDNDEHVPNRMVNVLRILDECYMFGSELLARLYTVTGFVQNHKRSLAQQSQQFISVYKMISRCSTSYIFIIISQHQHSALPLLTHNIIAHRFQL